MNGDLCTVEGCGRPRHARGLCGGHYQRWRTTGSHAPGHPLATPHRGTLAERFWSYVDKGPGHGPHGDCWLWTASLKSTGYGQIKVPGRRGSMLAHRVAVYLDSGEWPAAGVPVCHHCDVKTCVRPSHLYVGTTAQNNRDAIERGRHDGPKGDTHPLARLTVAAVMDIRNLHAAGVSQRELARRYGVNSGTVSRAVRGESWAHADTKEVTP